MGFVLCDRFHPKKKDQTNGWENKLSLLYKLLVGVVAKRENLSSTIRLLFAYMIELLGHLDQGYSDVYCLQYLSWELFQVYDFL